MVCYPRKLISTFLELLTVRFRRGSAWSRIGNGARRNQLAPTKSLIARDRSHTRKRTWQRHIGCRPKLPSHVFLSIRLCTRFWHDLLHPAVPSSDTNLRPEVT